MNRNALVGLCLLGFTSHTAAQLQEFGYAQPHHLPAEAQIVCFDGINYAPDYDITYFDIRLPPASQPSDSFSGTFVVEGDCDAGGSVSRSIGLSAICDGGYPDAGTNSLRFALAADPIPTGIPLYGPGGFPTAEIMIYTGFQPGESVGPDSTFSNFQVLGTAPFHTDPAMSVGSRHDIDVVGVENGIIIGIEIAETDGVHYGWIEIRRAPDADPSTINHCGESYFITRYAYELEPGVPALVTSECVADTNGDGSLTPADFGAWIAAFNSQSPACDQNGDTLCTPADFGAWITNFNAGC